MQNITTQHFSIALPKSWVDESTHGVYTFFDPEDGYGALQISVYRKKDIIKADILDLIKDTEDLSQLKEVEYADFNGFELITIDEATNFFRKIWAFNGDLMLFITYNCDTKDKERETKLVDKILLSLKPHYND